MPVDKESQVLIENRILHEEKPQVVDNDTRVQQLVFRLAKMRLSFFRDLY